ncbi:hypothetical protein PR001_g6539 [Phytophthora rubi]|uniref:Uncharacterized protein n=1 Tax=Phytophthora rubi TaxID=129364 RepID=A0A6A3NME3_9STRA|nr:hypothetical protein PR001_g6539 [Phytophthora rubi]
MRPRKKWAAMGACFSPCSLNWSHRMNPIVSISLSESCPTFCLPPPDNRNQIA